MESPRIGPYCRYQYLRNISLILNPRTCIEDFIEYTDSVLYENYRMDHLKSLSLNSSIDLIDVSMADGTGEKERLLREKQYEVSTYQFQAIIAVCSLLRLISIR